MCKRFTFTLAGDAPRPPHDIRTTRAGPPGSCPSSERRRPRAWTARRTRSGSARPAQSALACHSARTAARGRRVFTQTARPRLMARRFRSGGKRGRGPPPASAGDSRSVATRSKLACRPLPVSSQPWDGSEHLSGHHPERRPRAVVRKLFGLLAASPMDGHGDGGLTPCSIPSARPTIPCTGRCRSPREAGTSTAPEPGRNHSRSSSTAGRPWPSR